MKKQYKSLFLACLSLFLVSCTDYYDTDNDPIVYGKTYFVPSMQTDKAIYKPGETVAFTLQKDIPSDAKIRYSHLGKTIHEEALASRSWSWTPPASDYTGYLVDIYQVVDGKEVINQSIAIDVSSDWKKFPRYGFLSSYGKLSEKQISSNIEELNRYHINGIQFYDWMYDHQKPLAGTVENPAASWLDLIGRTNYLATVQGYIGAAGNRGMKTMFYNLAFGALKNAASDGVKEEWYIFKDTNHTEKDNHHLDAPFRSSIYITNPANTDWQAYLASRNKDVYAVLDFDGYHIDQLGNRGDVYDYAGNKVILEDTYLPFIQAMKKANPNKRLVMNAVSQYAQEKSISKSDVDFLYTEIWDESKTFEELAQVILDNNRYSDYKKSTVLAAYMNYKQSSTSGYVNTPGILLGNSVIFSFGGAHLELGEHYLTNEYFPNENLQMKTELKRALTSYYDFIVAYQNILRDGGTFANVNATSVDSKINIASWPADKGKVSVMGKTFADKEVVHFINFTNANSMEWRDTNASQTEPSTISDLEVSIQSSKTVSKVWFASPDVNGGVAQTLSYTQQGGNVVVTLPSLKYWDMLVLEY